MDLVELDVSGCWQVTDKSLHALQENLLHMRGESASSFSLTVGGQFHGCYCRHLPVVLGVSDTPPTHTAVLSQ